MSPTPEQRPRQLNAATQNNIEPLQIRVVPYSPPRFSSDASATFSVRAVSSAQHEPEAHSNSPQTAVQQPTQPTTGASSSTDRDRLKSTVSGQLRRTPSSTLSVSHDSDNASLSSRASSSASTPSARRPKRVITVNPDNRTFSLLPLSGSTASRTDSSFISQRMPSMTPSGSWGRVSSSVYILEDRETSQPPTNQDEQPFASTSPVPLNELSPAHSNRLPSSPWNWRSRSTDTTKPKHVLTDAHGDYDNVEGSSQLEEEIQHHEMPDTPEQSPKLPPMRAIFPSHHTISRRITNKDSFQSIASNSTLSERTNYKVYGQSSPAVGGSSLMYDDETHVDLETLPPSSRHSFSNYRILGESSDLESLSDHPRPPSGNSDRNFIVHGRSVSCSSLASMQTRLRQEFSQESLMVAPLRPARKRSFEHGGIIKSCSRESLRRASLSSIGTTLSQEATRSLFVGAASVVYIQGGLRKHNPRLISSGLGSGSGSAHPLVSHPHQWSAPLSTVMSESEGGSLPPSRSLSPYSATDRRSSANSRHILSMSSSFAGMDEQVAPLSHSRNGSLERPPIALHTRHSGRDLSGASPFIRDYDEHGDGLADLDILHHRPSRTRLVGRSNSGSDHVLRPSASTRSLNPLSFPAWARLYYCNGERRFLLAQASTDSMRSLYNGSLYNDQPPPGRAFLGHTPSIERMRDSIRSSRTRNRNPEGLNVSQDHEQELEVQNQPPVIETSNVAPDAIEAPSRVTSVVRRVKKQTSSIWSPHLHLDRRASRYSMWEPPVAPWSEETSFDWRRNLQTILFTVGFILPFSWIIAAFLPLPPKPVLEMTQHTHHSTSHLDLGRESSHSVHAVDEVIYNHARWWRNLNRVMAIVGILVIGAVIALTVVGVKQQWTK